MKKTSSKRIFGKCFYHLCRKRERLYHCHFCDEYFCKKHSKQRPSGFPRFKDTDSLSQKFMEEFHKEEGHPCWPYTNYWYKKIEKKKQEEDKAFDDFLNRSKGMHQQPVSFNVNTCKSKKFSSEGKIGKPNPKQVYTSKTHPIIRPTRKKFCKFIKRNSFLLLMVLLLLTTIGYIKGYHLIFFNTCEDGTLYNKCAQEKPYFCSEGELVKNSTRCGCSYGYEPLENDCSKIPTCQDGSFYSECGVQKPFYCYMGTLVEKASICGCPKDEIKDGEKCISKYQTNPKNVRLTYFNYEVYGGLNDYLAGLDRAISYSYTPPTTKDFILRDLDNLIQKEYLIPLVDKIKAKSDSPKEQAEMAIRMVQDIPYDWDAFETDTVTGRYPYEVLYDMKGVCMEKADLMAFLLRELGFGVAIFEFEQESHRAVGIKCSSGNYGSEYCFIEATDNYPVGRIPSEYVGGIDIRSAVPEIVVISDGKSF